MTTMKILVFRIVMPVGQMVLVELGAPINAVATSTVRRIVTLVGLMALAVPGALTFAIRTKSIGTFRDDLLKPTRLNFGGLFYFGLETGIFAVEKISLRFLGFPAASKSYLVSPSKAAR
jgi:hypothetical protein